MRCGFDFTGARRCLPCKRKYDLARKKFPGVREKQRATDRRYGKRVRADPVKRQALNDRRRVYGREWKAEKRRSDPAFRALESIRKNIWTAKTKHLRQTPEFRAKANAANRKTRAKYLALNPDYSNAFYRAWIRTPSGRARVRVLRQRRRARHLNAPGRHTAAEVENLFKEYSGFCCYCGGKATTIDHVIALSAGGSDDIDNLVPACGRCNSGKRDRPLLVWLASRARRAHNHA